MTVVLQKGKVTKKGSVITCTICGAKGHNKRYHGHAKSTSKQPKMKKLQVQNVTPSLSIQTEFDIPSHLVDLDDFNLHWTSLSQTIAGTQRPHQNTRSINELLSDIPTQSSGVNEDSQPGKKNGKGKTVKNKGKTVKNKGNKPFLAPRSASLSTASKKASGSNPTPYENFGKRKDKVQTTTKKARRKANVETATSKKKKPWMPAGLGDNSKP
ncbi:uncharacterized protein LOC125370692 [Ricinus communis]|uniref:uncharacterized protein LOC125370692 n=1 Tax=Ricinus communis TaxID=3988 RepID=UPI00201A26D8|nr:uncharacterized protein LOC125370692 [Ricinus communis]